MTIRKKGNTFHDLMLRGVKILNVIVITLPFVAVWYLYYASKIDTPFYRKGNWVVILLFVILYILFGRTYDAFLVSYNRISEMVYSQMLSVLITDFILYIVIALLAKSLLPVWPLLLSMAYALAFSVFWSCFAHSWYFKTFKAKKSAVVWEQRENLEYLIQSYGLSKKFDVIATPSVSMCVNDLSILEGVQAVFLSGVHSHERNIIIKYCIENNISAFVIPRIGDVLMSGAKRMHMFHLPILRLERYSPSPEYLFIKRAFDIVSSTITLIIFSPLMIIVAILIRKDGGPVFYKQKRLTKDGKEFYVLKFRSMRVDAEKDGVARLSSGENDERITPVGKVIRKLRIDELPQLINILTGDMSVVGPRPERPEIASQYEEVLPEFKLRLQAKCGLTGYAQVYGKYNTTPYDKLQMDLMYIANPSLAQDLSIIFATIKILFIPESTEGIAEGQTTAMAMGSETQEAKKKMDDEVLIHNDEQ